MPTAFNIFAMPLLAKAIRATNVSSKDLPAGYEFNPRELFKASEQGIWLDPSDFSMLYQDAAGTTPVTAVGQPVGLALDKRLGLVLGAELITNGDFAAGATGWTVTGNDATHIATFAGGTLRYQSDTTTPALTISQAGVLTIGKWYEITTTVSSYTSGSIKSDAVTPSVIASGLGVTRVKALAVSTSFNFLQNIANVDMTIDSISIKELPGNHAYQTTLAAKPTAQSNYLSLDKTDDHLLVAAGGAGTTGFLLVAGIMVPAAAAPPAAGTARTLWSDQGTNTGYKVGIDASNQIFLSAGNGVAFVTATGPALVAGTKYVITAWHDGANLNISVNNGAPTQAAFATATVGTAAFTIGKSNGAATEYWGDRIYGMVYRKNDTSNAGQRSSLYSYMVGKMGGL